MLPNMLGGLGPSRVEIFLYKCISKVICMRIKGIIPTVVARNHEVIVAGRSLTHNILICRDQLRHYTRKTSRRCLMKIDLRKTYAMVRWNLIEDVLRGFVFPVYFLQLIKTCVTFTTFTVKVNGVGHAYFERKRGLRTRGPMSPLFFVLVNKYLSRILEKMSELLSF